MRLAGRRSGLRWAARPWTASRPSSVTGDDAVGSLARKPHWHLTWLGVEPGHQGQGIGSTLVRQLTTRADAEGMACWLFTFASRNVPIYERLGFRVTLERLLPSSGPRLWVMAHPPRSQP